MEKLKIEWKALDLFDCICVYFNLNLFSLTFILILIFFTLLSAWIGAIKMFLSLSLLLLLLLLLLKIIKCSQSLEIHIN